MIYSLVIFILLIARNYSNKNELFLLDSILVQVFIIIMFKINIGLYGIILGLCLMGEKIRRMQIGNEEGDRRY